MEALFKAALISRGWPIPVRYGLTSVAVISMVLLGFAFDREFPGYALLLCFLAIILSSVIFDSGTGIYATILSAMGVAYFILEPSQSVWVNEKRDLIAIALFALIGFGTATLIEALHKAFITISKAHDALELAANRNKVLLHELSHRMRNDLSSIVSLLMLQASSSENKIAQEALMAAADRVRVLARVHTRLAIHDDNTVVDTGEFITELCEDLKVTLTGFRPIVLRLSVENRPIALQRGVALGLIINELLTNALKYAFPDGRAGEIVVEFGQCDENYRLTVRDNGIGLSHGQNPEGLGHRLVRTLAGQLNGNVDVSEADPGALFVITFPK
jgi:two-component sensor histidine kinase